MLQPVTSGPDLIREIDLTITPTPALWWLGHAGFVIRFANITFYIDPCFSDPPGKPRLCASPLSGDQVRHADMILATHAHPGHLDASSLVPMLFSSPQAKLVLPRSSAPLAHASGIPSERTTPTDNGLRIEYFKENLYGRIYAVPSAHPQLDWTQAAGYPYLGYLIRFGRWTIYHAGDCAMYDGLADRLRPFNVNIALLPIGGSNFSPSEAAQLAEDIGAAWVIPMHYGTFLEPARATEPGAAEPGGRGDNPAGRAGPARASEDQESAFVAHMLGHRPDQRFHVFRCGEKWTAPEE